ncbi:zinc finger family protein [Tripterygium wilfordii]|uniref:RING-type E3 ubiquitin transferase n=1 Tax=Tripterygium wilfordii TaxID=458696 RepID=A0A7J7CNV2_TRIWF|nr:E3 ubiquitin-protein ligase SIRP1-like [Tripterygium wilfordii]XP_038725951.1 E3 ubiquitin-protein ligase SIRP1-like [Tripterygium wilfordii]KAF5735679.1 zinc finger family protein [Tripterygium wilfordii]
MDEAMVARYWCHMCSQMVNPITEIEIKCPFCQSGFVEEMGTTTTTRDSHDPDPDPDFGSDRALSLWAPILLGMMGNPRHRLRRFRRRGIDDDFDDNQSEVNDDVEAHREGETELDRELESIIRRRRRSSGAIVQLLQGIRAGMIAEANNNAEGENTDSNRERERVILINPFNQAIIVQGSYGSSGGQNQNQGPIGSLGDYFVGPGLDLLLQHLAENDPNRYGTPPAQKEAIEAMPTVTIKENLQCSVCLDDFEIGTEAKEMPCKHKFHNACILPWLELHSSCPVCRFQLPSDESKLDSDRSRSSNNQRGDANSTDHNGHDSNGGEAGDGEGRSGGGRRFSIPWPFSGLFSSSGGNSSSSSSSSSNAAGNFPQTDEN